MSKDKFQNKYRIPSARAAWHDYNGGMYFITICTQNKEHYFGEIVGGNMQMTDIGKYAEECVQKIETLHNDIFVPLYVIMPNHVHLVILVNQCAVETSYYGVSTKATKTINTEPYYDISTQNEKTKNIDPYCGVSTKNDTMQKIANQCGSLSHLVSRFKSAVTKYIKC